MEESITQLLIWTGLFERNWTFRLHNQHIGQTPPVCCSTSEISRRDFTRLLQTDSQLFTKTQPPHQWRHIVSEPNPADEVSRSLTVEETCANSKWLNVPQFLTKKDEFWPRDPTLHEPELSDDDPEIKRTQSNSQSSSRHQSEDVLSSLIERHSSWERLKRAVAWLHRFRLWFIDRYRRSPISSKVKSSANRRILSVDEMKEAEREIIKHREFHFSKSCRPCKGLVHYSTRVRQLQSLRT